MFVGLNDVNESITDVKQLRMDYGEGYYTLCINKHEYRYMDKETRDKDYEKIKNILLSDN